MTNKSLSAVELFSGTSQSIILIESDLRIGTGFVVLLVGRPLIVTCKHVVEDPWAMFPIAPGSQPVAHSLKVGFGADQLFELPGYYLVNNLDLALLEVPASLQIKTLSLRKTPVQPGETVYTIGFPIGLGRSITQGIVDAIYSDAIQFSAPISSGNSGGPLLDVHGEVIGVVIGSVPQQNGAIVQNLNYAIPVASVPLLMLPRESRKGP